MSTLTRVARRLGRWLTLLIGTGAGLLLLSYGAFTFVEASLIVFGIGTVTILVGLAAQAVQGREATHQVAHSIADEIARLGSLRREGVLTDDEFAEAKRRVLLKRD